MFVDGICILNKALHITYWSSGCEKLFGYSRDVMQDNILQPLEFYSANNPVELFRDEIDYYDTDSSYKPRPLNGGNPLTLSTSTSGKISVLVSRQPIHCNGKTYLVLFFELPANYSKLQKSSTETIFDNEYHRNSDKNSEGIVGILQFATDLVSTKPRVFFILITTSLLGLSIWRIADITDFLDKAKPVIQVSPKTDFKVLKENADEKTIRVGD